MGSIVVATTTGLVKRIAFLKRSLPLVGLAVLLGMLSYNWSFNRTSNIQDLAISSQNVQLRRQLFAVENVGCKIPLLEPYDSTIQKYVHTSGRIQCRSKPLLTYVEDNWLRINKTVWEMDYNNEIRSCRYRPLVRGDNDWTIKYKSATVFNNDTQIHDEFIRVKCLSGNRTVLYTYFHVFLTERPVVEERCGPLEKGDTLDSYNIILFGTDSMSRSNFVRQLPKTRDFIMKQLNGIEFLGYNKIGDNTLPNMAAMLTGKYITETLDVNVHARLPADFLPLLLSNYSARGYRTMFAEDAPNIATFNYLRDGFLKPPADYYPRPYMLAVNRQKSIWSDAFCAGPYTETELLLDYVTKVLARVKNKRHFFHVFFSAITHDFVNKASSIDDIYHNFFNNAKEMGYLNNTILLFFSDHGIRFGDLRETYVGRLEERLPGFYVAFPKRFEEKHPERVRNVRVNAHRLTTPFDVHETLLNLIGLTGAQNRSLSGLRRGLSLFDEVPANRTCSDATIVDQWCTCHEDQIVFVADAGVQNATRFAVSKINQALSTDMNLCANLTLSEVKTARKQTTNSAIKVERSPRITYHVTFRTLPGDGLFEATVSLTTPSGNHALLGDISRINRYAGQSDCINDPRKRLYCFCNSLLEQTHPPKS